MRNFLIITLGVLLVISCKNQKSEVKTAKIDFTQYVNPFIGTSKMGHTFPGATAPFGMVQLSP